MLGTSRKTPVANGAIFFDLSQDEGNWPEWPQFRTAVVCAGIGNLEACRRDLTARHVNVDQTLKLFRKFHEMGCFTVFLSTNLVFDGETPFRRAEEGMCPMTAYGRQKAEVEGRLSDPRSTAIIRLTKVFHRGMPIVQQWMRSLQAGQPVSAFVDYICSPIPLSMVVRGLAAIAEGCLGGMWQFSGSEDVSYADIARHFASRQDSSKSLVRPVSARLGGQIEHLPRHATLDTSRARWSLGLEFPATTSILDDL